MNRVLKSALAIITGEKVRLQREEAFRSIDAIEQAGIVDRDPEALDRDPEALDRLDLVQVGAWCFHRALRRPGRPVMVIEA